MANGRRSRHIAGVVLLAVTLVGCGKSAPRVEATGCGPVTGFISEGQLLTPECKIEILGTGVVTTIRDFRGASPMVLNFWASWCPFCIKEMPDFQRAYTSLGARVKFLGLDLLNVQGERKSNAIELAKRTGVTYPLGYDDGGSLYNRAAPKLLMPTTLFIRADGTLAFRQFGPLTEQQLRELITKYLDVT